MVNATDGATLLNSLTASFTSVLPFILAVAGGLFGIYLVQRVIRRASQARV